MVVTVSSSSSHELILRDVFAILLSIVIVEHANLVGYKG